MSHRTWRTGEAARRAGAVLAIAGASFALAAPQAALATTAKPKPKGANGVLQIHGPGTPADDRRSEPQVCSFYLAGFDFDAGQTVSWEIQSMPPTGAKGPKSDRDAVAENTLTLGSAGTAQTSLMRLRDGHYQLSWTSTGVPGKGKHKTFKVDCEGVEEQGGQQGGNQQPGGKDQGQQAGKGNGSGQKEVSRNDWDASDVAGAPGNGNGGGNVGGAGQQKAEAAEDKGGLPFTGRTVAAATSTGFGLILVGGLALAMLRRRRTAFADGLESAGTAAESLPTEAATGTRVFPPPETPATATTPDSPPQPRYGAPGSL